jgi:hypothetical protein
MRKFFRLLVLLPLLGSGGCAMLRPSDRPDPGAELELGIAALEAGDYAAASERLYPLYRFYWKEPVGQRALLALIAAEIDPRNPGRRLWSTQDLAGSYTQIPGTAGWTRPIAESFYLLAAELGAAEERLARAEAERDAATRAAEGVAASTLALPGPTVPERIRNVTAQRDELQRRVQQLENDVAQRDRQLREREQELERIRRTIRG